MCEVCDKVVAMIEKTQDGKSVVAWPFPNGEPKLIVSGARDGSESKA